MTTATIEAPAYLPTVDELVDRVWKQWCVRIEKHRNAVIGLHCWPQRHDGSEGWFAIGPMSWGAGWADSWYDVRLNRDADYHILNERLEEACLQLDIPYENMA